MKKYQEFFVKILQQIFTKCVYFISETKKHLSRIKKFNTIARHPTSEPEEPLLPNSGKKLLLYGVLTGVASTLVIVSLVFIFIAKNNISNEQQIMPPSKQTQNSFKQSKNSEKEVKNQRIEEKKFDITNFIDETQDYKGYRIRGLFLVDTSIFQSKGDSLRYYVGRDVGFIFYHNDRTHITIHIPEGLSVPNAGYSDKLVVEFICKEGNLHRGNEAISIIRPPEK